jgi:hypothetical protein
VRLLFSFVKLVTGGYDLQGRVGSFFGTLFGDATAHPLSPVEAAVTSTLHCTYNSSVQCLKHGQGRLGSVAFWYALESVAVLTGLRVLRLGPLAVVLTPALFFMAWPVIMNRAYGLEYGCSLSLTPAVPVCFLSDAQSLMYELTPQKFPWPSPLVKRNGTNFTVFDCTAIGFGDGGVELAYFLNAYAPGWRDYFPSVTVSSLFGNKVRDAIVNTPTGISPLTTQCAALFSASAVPVLLLLVFFAAFFLAALHVAFVAFAYLARAGKQFYFAFIAAYLAVIAQ